MVYLLYTFKMFRYNGTIKRKKLHILSNKIVTIVVNNISLLKIHKINNPSASGY